MDFRSRELPLLARLGLTGCVATLAFGLWASFEQIERHHSRWDGDPSSVSYTDLLGTYHGVEIPAPFPSALGRGHPEGLSDPDRQALLDWVGSDRMSDLYDDIDSDYPPAELIADSCLSCHSRQAPEDVRIEPYLEYYDDVAATVEAMSIKPPPDDILVVTTHTHALTMSVMSLVLGVLLLATRLPALVSGGLFAAAGLALAADIASWWLARENAMFVRVIMVAGGVYAVSMSLSCLAVLLDLWLPSRKP